MHHAVRALVHAWRALRRTPTLTLASVLTLALGVGPSTAIFSVVYGVLLRPLPYRDPATLVRLNYVRAGGQTSGFAIPELPDWTTAARGLEDVTMYGGASSINLSGGPETALVRGSMVSAQFFHLLQPTMALGRPLTADDAAAPDVVVSAQLWQRRYGGSPRALGQAITLDGVAYTIVGVAPETFQFPSEGVDVWMPIDFAKTTLAAQWRMRGFRACSLIGRLAPGATFAEANAEAAATARRLARAYPRFNADLSADVTPLQDRLTAPVRPALWMLFGAVGCVWLIACANLANLTLARSAPRVREVAVRAALGASRRDIAAQFTVECAIVAAAGGALGVFLASLCLRGLEAAAPANLPRLADIRIDTPVLAFALGLAVLATFVFGTLPAVRGSRARPIDALRDARTTTNAAARRVHQALIVVEVAIAVVLLVGALLFVRSLDRLLGTNTGAHPAGVLTMKVNIAPAAFKDPSAQAALMDRVTSDLTRLPGVEAVGLTSDLPPNLDQMRSSFTLRTATATVVRDFDVEMVSMSGDTLGALGVPLLAGRAFTPADTAASRRVLILSERAAKSFFPDRDPIGQTLPFGNADPKALPPEVVGVVGNVKYSGLDTPIDGAVYMPYAQQPFRTAYLAMRTAGDPLALGDTARRTVLREDAALAVSDARSLDQVVSASVAEPRMRTTLLALMAGLALLLAAVGLYGVIAYGVTQRTPEIGVRMALGAQPRDVLAMIMREGAWLTLTGVVLGVVAARLLTSVVARFLYGVTATDGLSFAVAAAFLLGLGAVATFVPARRATKVDPMVAWRTLE